jgi:hypothetical protein
MTNQTDDVLTKQQKAGTAKSNVNVFKWRSGLPNSRKHVRMFVHVLRHWFVFLTNLKHELPRNLNDRFTNERPSAAPVGSCTTYLTPTPTSQPDLGLSAMSFDPCHPLHHQIQHDRLNRVEVSTGDENDKLFDFGGAAVTCLGCNGAGNGKSEQLSAANFQPTRQTEGQLKRAEQRNRI